LLVSLTNLTHWQCDKKSIGSILTSSTVLLVDSILDWLGVESHELPILDEVDIIPTPVAETPVAEVSSVIANASNVTVSSIEA
jgi:hypothetical protein